jgi:hypothetical protein
MRNHPAKAGRSIEFDLLASLALGAGICVITRTHVKPLPKSIWIKLAVPHTGRDERLLVQGQADACPSRVPDARIESKNFSAVV